MTLSIPAIAPDADIVTAALAYASAGWYVLPVKRETKHPGSVLGKGWPAKSSRDPQQIVAWFAGSGDGLALHCGRSGAVVFDVDTPENIPAELADEIESARPPAQASRRDNLQRAHYLFLQPPGRSIGNGGGKLGGTWGEVRGKNGIIVVEPTPHSKPDGLYRWLRGGRLPVLGDTVAQLLPDQTNSEDAATDAEADEFLAGHTGSLRPELLEGVANSLRTAMENGESRHESTVTAVCWALREAQAGMYDAKAALAVLWLIFRDSLRDEPGRLPAAEWRGIVAWAIAQAKLDDAGTTRAKLSENEPFASGAMGDIGDAPTDPVEAMRAELLDTDGLDSIEDLRPLVKGVLSLDTVARINGKSGHGKSFIALDISAHIGTGRAWHDHNVAKGEVIYLVAEGARGIRRRVRAWEKHYGVKMTGVWFLPRPVNVGSPQWLVLTQLVADIRPVLIVIDTQARVTVGMNENDNSEMGVLVEHMERMRRATSACVLLVHHLGHNGEEGRGATAVKAALQTELLVNRKERIVTLTNPKQKDDVDDLDMPFTMSTVDLDDDDDGYPITSVVILPADVEARTPEPDWIRNATPNQATIIGIVREHAKSVGLTKPEVRKLMRDQGRDIPDSSYYDAWNFLESTGRLMKAEGSKYVFRTILEEDDHSDSPPDSGFRGLREESGP